MTDRPTCGRVIHSLYSHNNISVQEPTLYRHTDRSENSVISFSEGIVCCIKSNCHHWGGREVNSRHNKLLRHCQKTTRFSHIMYPLLLHLGGGGGGDYIPLLCLWKHGEQITDIWQLKFVVTNQIMEWAMIQVNECGATLSHSFWSSM